MIKGEIMMKFVRYYQLVQLEKYLNEECQIKTNLTRCAFREC